MRFLLVGLSPLVLAACAAAPLAPHVEAEVAYAQAAPAAACKVAPEPEDAAQAWIMVGLPLQHQPVKEVYDDLRRLLTGHEECRFVPNELSNTLVIFGAAPMVDRVRDLVGQLDLPARPAGEAP